jgi:hypothetical protein
VVADSGGVRGFGRRRGGRTSSPWQLLLTGVFPLCSSLSRALAADGIGADSVELYLVLAVCTGSVVPVCAAVFWGLALACVWSGRDSLVFWRILLPFFPAPLGCCVQWHLGAYGHAF